VKRPAPLQRFLRTLFIVCSFASLAVSLYTGNWNIFGAWFLVCLLGFITCLVLTLINGRAPVENGGSDENGRTLAATKWDGVFSLGWVSAWGTVFYLCIFGRHVDFEQFGALSLAVLAVWWGVGLLFAISAVRRGSLVNSLCGLATILGFIFFLNLLIFPTN